MQHTNQKTEEHLLLVIHIFFNVPFIMCTIQIQKSPFLLIRHNYNIQEIFFNLQWNQIRASKNMQSIFVLCVRCCASIIQSRYYDKIAADVFFYFAKLFNRICFFFRHMAMTVATFKKCWRWDVMRWDLSRGEAFGAILTVLFAVGCLAICKLYAKECPKLGHYHPLAQALLSCSLGVHGIHITK